MWNSIRRTALMVGMWLMASASHAQIAPLIFEREDIRIESPTPKPTETNAASTGHAPLTFNTEVRNETALTLETLHSLGTLAEGTGVMIAFTAPGIVPLPTYPITAPLDVLFVMENGSIAQIMPSVVLPDLTEEIIAKSPVKAFIFLPGGTVKMQQIKPLDMVYASRFNPPPNVMK